MNSISVNTCRSVLLAIVFISTAIHWHRVSFANEPAPDATVENSTSAEGPREVVSRWLELHRTGERKQASALTTGSHHHRARYALPSTRDTGVRVQRSLGNQRASAVVTGPVHKSKDENPVLLFWLLQRDDQWRIHKSYPAEKSVVEDQLRGFLEAGDVRWHVQRDDVLGDWDAGPGNPPVGGGIACGSRLQIGDDNRFRLVSWGPGGPHPQTDDVIVGSWRIDGDQLVLSHDDETDACRIVWVATDRFDVESLDGQGSAVYERVDADQG